MRIGEWFKALMGWWRQRRFPRAWRIGPPLWASSAWKALEEIIQVLRKDSERSVESSKNQQPSPAEEGILLPQQGAASIGTTVFRMHQLVQSPSGRSPEEMFRLLSHHAKSLLDTLAESGLRIHDHTGEIIPDTGACELHILTFQPTPGVAGQIVLETIKPSVWYKEQVIQRGQVIVAAPCEAGEKEPSVSDLSEPIP